MEETSCQKMWHKGGGLFGFGGGIVCSLLGSGVVWTVDGCHLLVQVLAWCHRTCPICFHLSIRRKINFFALDKWQLDSLWSWAYAFDLRKTSALLWKLLTLMTTFVFMLVPFPRCIYHLLRQTIVLVWEPFGWTFGASFAKVWMQKHQTA